MALDYPVATPFPIEWAQPFVDAAIPKLEDLSLEFCKAHWSTYEINGDYILYIVVNDTIAHEVLELQIPQKTIFSWSNAKSDRAREYVMELAIADVVLSNTEPVVKTNECNLGFEWTDLYDDWCDFESFTYSF